MVPCGQRCPWISSRVTNPPGRSSSIAKIANDWSGTRNLVPPFRSSREERSNANAPNRTGRTAPAAAIQTRLTLPPRRLRSKLIQQPNSSVLMQLPCDIDVSDMPGAMHRVCSSPGSLSSHEYFMEDDIAGGARRYVGDGCGRRSGETTGRSDPDGYRFGLCRSARQFFGRNGDAQRVAAVP